MERLEHRGWETFRLRSPSLEVDVVPGRGGEILAVRYLPKNMDILWRSPDGLRPRTERAVASDSYAEFIDPYPGGWQTVFPNAGAATRFEGVEHTFHGEAWRAPLVPTIIDGALTLEGELSTLPFAMRKQIRVEDDRVTIEESMRYLGSGTARVMWVHHPAFGAPFLSRACTIQADARTFVTDDERDVGDLAPGRRTAWPYAQDRTGNPIDLRRVPREGAGIERMGYLTDFERGHIRIENGELNVQFDLEWDAELFPYAWLWLDANGSTGHPTFGRWYVMAIEPASSYPAQGLEAADRKTGTLLHFDPGQERTITISLTVSES